ncbi:MAG TPA: hypothetical protein VFE82_17545 [Ramlibacter sp.]|jgi:hypothetical protein|uniref:hypothetical protein n=1 Tax=Ramlibacter sp. TaxID=1917967 RepID=UPI002D496669|nr:hypothetical protein [Ramlibacter sp.]HZY20279.1 hypothetical protein [Ramlibacter sp.]
MKIASILLACSLGLGVAAASAQTGNASSTGQSPAAGPGTGGTVVDKAKRGAKRIGEKTRNALNRADGRDQQAQDSTTQGGTGTMGASGRRGGSAGASSTAAGADSTRQQRMDEAYSRWQSQGPR